MFSAGKSGRIKETYRKKIREENRVLTTSLPHYIVVQRFFSFGLKTHPPPLQLRILLGLRRMGSFHLRESRFLSHSRKSSISHLDFEVLQLKKPRMSKYSITTRYTPNRHYYQEAFLTPRSLPSPRSPHIS